MNIIKLFIYAVIIAVVLTFIQRQFFPKIETVTVTHTVVDTTLVDSLYQVIEYLENIPEPEQKTIVRIVEIPTPVIEEDKKIYRTGLSDLAISIGVESTIENNSLVAQQIEYIMKQRLVRESKLELTYHINTLTTVTTTRTINKSFVSIGGIVSQHSIIPSLSYTTRSNTTFLAGYDIINESISAGILIPLF